MAKPTGQVEQEILEILRFVGLDTTDPAYAADKIKEAMLVLAWHIDALEARQ